MALVGACMFSLTLLFAVSATGQGFYGSETALANPFSPDNVMAVLDSTSHGYSNFVAANITEPFVNSMNVLAYSCKENLAFVFDNSSDKILAMAGMSDLVWTEPTPIAHPAFKSLDKAQVAGAFIRNESQ